MKNTIRFTTKQGNTARPDITVHGGEDYAQRVAKETLAIHAVDTYTYTIERGGKSRHYFATNHKPLA
jgi:hypothetical protein